VETQNIKKGVYSCLFTKCLYVNKNQLSTLTIFFAVLLALSASSVTASDEATCEGADLTFDVSIWTVGIDCHSSNRIQDSTVIDVPVAGTHKLNGIVSRGHPGQCQINEAFTITINGDTGPVAEDDADACAETVHPDFLGEFNFNEGANTVIMDTAAECPPDKKANSVSVRTLCIFYGHECGDGIKDEGEACDDGNDDNFDECRNDCSLPTEEIPLNTCVGDGELFVYQGDQSQDIDTSFVVNRDELLIFARANADIAATVNNVATPLALVEERTSPFHIKIYSLDTSPGDVVGITGTAPWNARSVQGFIAQDSLNPVYDLSSLEIIVDDEKTNDMFLLPDSYNYVIFDKYTQQNNGNPDNRNLRVVISGPPGTIEDSSFTQPFPVGVQGVVVGEFEVTESGVYTQHVDTKDSVYWMLVQCPEPLCGDGNLDDGEDCDDGNQIDDDECSNECLFTFCGDEIIQTPNGQRTGGPLNDGDEACDDGNQNTEDACTPQCTLTFCGDEIIQTPNGLGQVEQCDDGNAVDGDGCDHKCRLEECGNGRLDPGEVCDDGNDDDFDECRNDCTVPSCGDGVVDEGETCDDGNQIDDDECRNDCSLPFCGDGIVDEGEACDDGNNDGSNGCNNVCQLTFCGDRTIQNPNGLGLEEQCDDGNVLDGDGCDQRCQVEFCGDGVQQSGEACDDGNQVDDDECRNDCTVPSCGDGIQDVGEDCDDGNDNNNDECRNDCTAPFCGDGLLDSGEDCDDGNQVDDDECTNLCTNTFCGDGVIQDPNSNGQSESCDDGNNDGTNGCSNVCTLTFCGDGTIQNPNGLGLEEQCDDGNVLDGDGCDQRCQVEFCGDGIVQEELGEICDDGNQDDNDGCSAQCLPELCGDGIQQLGEACDDGNDDDFDECRNDCTVPFCGDFIVDEEEACDEGPIGTEQCDDQCSHTFCGDTVVQTPNGERIGGPLNDGNEDCDDGNFDQADQCTSFCTLTFCGDEIIQTPNGLGQTEQCDDGNAVDGDGCDHKCRLEECGNGRVEDGEVCDDGNDDDFDECRNDCTIPECGDGVVDEGEACDDGNQDDNDGCSSQCLIEFCGDGIQQSGEACDDGNDNDFDECRNDCTVPFCGDFIVDEGEVCDDGPQGSDTCSPECTTIDICQAALDIMFVIDRSGSMNSPDPQKFQDAKDAAITFVQSMNFNLDTAGVASFSMEATLDQSLTSEEAAVITAINSLGAGGSTDLGDGVLVGRNELNANSLEKPIMIVLSDGAPNHHPGGFCFVDPSEVNACTDYALSQATLAKDSGITVFTIGLGVSPFTEGLLTDMATSDSHFFFAPTSAELEEIYNEISNAACFCGNGELDENEQCDGILGVGEHQTCTEQCTLRNLTFCGDGIKQQPNDDEQVEECDGDDGVEEHQTCSEQCTIIEQPFCGDGNIDQGEDCDDGNDNNNDECRNDCTAPFCGDEIVDSGEECDDGANNDLTNGCTNVCTLTFCGDGTIQNPNGLEVEEQCDDGNVLDGDGCDQRCQVEECQAEISAMLLIDRSGSMANPDPQKFQAAKNGAIAFVNSMNFDLDVVGVASFNNTANVDQGLTDNDNAVIAAINSLVSVGTTNIGEGIVVAAVELVGQDSPVLIILSDGAPNVYPGGFCFVDPHSPTPCTEYAADQAAIAKGNGVEIFTIGLGVNDFTEGLLKEMASTEAHFFGATAEELEGVYLQISEAACS